MLFIVLFVSVSIAQEQKKESRVEFKKCIRGGNEKESLALSRKGYRYVKFKIRNVNSQEIASFLLLELQEKFDIKKSRLDNIGRFAAFIKKDITADQIRLILLNQNYDYDFKTVQLVDKTLIESLKNKK